MALFNRDYDREYGYRGTTYGRGYDRDVGNRGGNWWERTKDRVSNAFGGNDYDRGYRGYDRGVGYGGTAGGRWGSTGYGRGGGQYGGTTGGFGTTAGYGTTGYDRGLTGRNNQYGSTGYDRGVFETNRYDREYDSNYKSRQQTDQGDPFGDRQSGTPIRVVNRDEERGSDWKFWRNDEGRERGRGYDRGFGGTRYDRDYSSNPMGYDPYGGGGYRQAGRRVNEYEGQHRQWGVNRNREYDRGWF